MATASAYAGDRPVATVEHVLPPARSRVSWAAIFIGAVVAIAIGAMLNLLGIAIGAASVDAVDRQTPDAATFAIGGGVWMAAAHALGMLAGGLVAGRLLLGQTRHEAALHGLGVWAIGVLIAMMLIGSAMSGATVAAVRGASGAASTVAAVSATAGAAAASQADPSAIAEALGRRITAPSDPSAASREEVAAEFGDLLRRRVMQGSWQGDERQRAEQLLGVMAGLSPEEARTRLAEAERTLAARAAQAEDAARKVADAAAAATTVAAFWTFAAMVLAMGAAVLGALMASAASRVPVVAPAG